MIKILPVILVRMDSSRLPGKCLLNLPTGQTVLEFIFGQLTALPYSKLLSKPVIATTDREIDQPIIDYAKKNNIIYYRGSTHDVLLRILEAGIFLKADYVMRVNGDSLFIDRDLVSNAIKVIKKSNVDVITNLMPRSYPYGISLQILKIKTFIEYINKIEPTIVEKEHITPYIERISDSIKIHNILNNNILNNEMRFTIDTIDDYNAMYKKLEKFKNTNGSNIFWRHI